MPLDLQAEKKVLNADRSRAERGDFGSENLEHGVERKERQETISVGEQEVSKTSVSADSSAGVGAPGIDTTKSALHQSVENILEEDLEEIYLEMNPDSQEKFKIEGEKTTQQIMALIHKTKATFKKIFKLITNWLKIIPGINKFFLEQEAKIKTDKILKIK